MADARKSINNVIVTIALEMKWEPGVIAKLSWNNRKDYTSAIYWYDEVIEYQKKNASGS